jgi:hypothetical protein
MLCCKHHSVNDEECEECYDKLEELLDTRKSRSKKGVSTSMWNICNSNFSTLNTINLNLEA